MTKISFLSKTNLFLRSLIYVTINVVIMIPYSFICIAAFPFPLAVRTAIVLSFTRFNIWSLKKICGINYQIEGLENIPKDRVGIIFCKHQSTWETFILPGLFKLPAVILKRELLWVPFFGWGLATVDPIAIDRNKKSSAMEQILKKGKKCLDQGRWILIFPEGTRIPYGKVGKYRLGGARLAVATGYPILPIAHNAGRFWPRRQFIKIPGTVHVVIGPLIESQNRTPEELLQETKEWIENTVIKINEK